MAMLIARKVLREEDSLGQSLNFFGGSVHGQETGEDFWVEFAWLRIITQMTFLKSAKIPSPRLTHRLDL